MQVGVWIYKQEVISATAIETAKFGANEYNRLLALSSGASWENTPNEFSEKLTEYTKSRLMEHGVNISIVVDAKIDQAANGAVISIDVKQKSTNGNVADEIIATSKYRITDRGVWITKLSGK